MENAAESKWQDGFGKRLQMVRDLRTMETGHGVMRMAAVIQK